GGNGGTGTSGAGPGGNALLGNVALSNVGAIDATITNTAGTGGTFGGVGLDSAQIGLITATNSFGDLPLKPEVTGGSGKGGGNATFSSGVQVQSIAANPSGQTT